jgi:DNA (cytosine-5)-methyltransferase 1
MACRVPVEREQGGVEGGRGGEYATMKTGVSLFTGGGLCDVGLSSLVSWAAGVEYDPDIAAHAAHALGHPVHCADVREVDYRQWAGVDYLHMSPPCTNASVANAKAGETEVDLALAAACIRAVQEIRPGYVTLENVRQYRNFESFRDILNCLSGQGYRVHFASYDAADFGVPQHRNRLMLRAWREDRPLPEVLPTHGSPREVQKSRAQGSLFGDTLLPWIGWYEAIADLLPSCPETKLAPWQIKRLTAEYGEEWLGSLLVNGVPLSHAGGVPPPL